MKPVRPAFDDDDLRPTNLSAAPPAETDPDDPLDPLKLRCASQLTKDIARLRTTKAKLQTEITTLQQDYERLQTDVQSLRHLADWAERGVAIGQSAAGGPLLPGESSVLPLTQVASTTDEPLELPIPATSAQRRGQSRQSGGQTSLRKGLVLSAIATVLAAWHYGLIGVLGQGGLWLGFDIGQLGTGFVPSVALLWLRMLVIVPALVLLAPQLYARTWEDLQTWVYTQEQLLALLIGSGVALFFSQALIYQSIGAVGPAIGVVLLFLYPLTAVPLGFTRQEQAVTPLGLLALVAIAMGGWLVIRPALSTADPTAILLGGLGSICFGIYVGLTNLSYRQRCHPIPASIVQFSMAAVLSSLVLLVKPLQLANISWMGFFLWGLLLGVVMLLAYLFNYSSLRLIGMRTATVAAATPLVAVLLAWSFTPTPSLETIQWTGIALVTIGGVAFGKEKLSDSPQP